MQPQRRPGYHVGVTLVISHFDYFRGKQCPKTIISSKSRLSRKVLLSLVTPTNTPDQSIYIDN
ncbi:hypothetical protein RSAG8_07149, partial [Rhizoctonia solani AG-8 WAC10335]